MRKSMVLFGLTVMFAVGLTRSQVRSASEDPPLLASVYIEPRQYVLYQYINGEWNIVPIEGYYEGSLSPDGVRLVYLRVPPFLQALMDGGQDWISGTAQDIAVMDLRDMSWHDVAVQPTTITTDANGYSGGINRSPPVWSPDGNALAWTEQGYPSLNSARLMVYDFHSNTSRILDDALPQMNLSSDGLPVFFNWGEPGIVVFTNDPLDFTETLRFYNVETGNLQIVPILDYGLEWYPIIGPLWVEDTQTADGGEVAVVQAASDLWYEFDPATGGVAGVGAQLELVSAVNPVESLRLVWNIYADTNSPAWQLVTSSKKELLTWAEPLRDFNTHMELNRFVIAPSGQTIAYLEDGTLSLWQDGAAVEIASPEGLPITALHWGPVYWQFGASYSLPLQDAD